MEMEVLSLQILDQNIFPPKISTKISCEAIILNVNLVFITFELIKLRIEKVEKVDFFDKKSGTPKRDVTLYQ